MSSALKSFTFDKLHDTKSSNNISSQPIFLYDIKAFIEDIFADLKCMVVYNCSLFFLLPGKNFSKNASNFPSKDNLCRWKFCMVMFAFVVIRYTLSGSSYCISSVSKHLPFLNALLKVSTAQLEHSTSYNKSALSNVSSFFARSKLCSIMAHYQVLQTLKILA